MACYSPWGCKESDMTERTYHTVHGVLAAKIQSGLPFPPPFTSPSINSCAAAAADLNTIWKEFKVESRKEAVCTQGKNWQDRSSDRYFQELIL